MPVAAISREQAIDSRMPHPGCCGSPQGKSLHCLPQNNTHIQTTLRLLEYSRLLAMHISSHSEQTSWADLFCSEPWIAPGLCAWTTLVIECKRREYVSFNISPVQAAKLAILLHWKLQMHHRSQRHMQHHPWDNVQDAQAMFDSSMTAAAIAEKVADLQKAAGISSQLVNPYGRGTSFVTLSGWVALAALAALFIVIAGRQAIWKDQTAPSKWKFC